MSKLTDHYCTVPLPFLKQLDPETGTLKLDTKATIDLFLRSIPKEIIEKEKKDFPHSLSCLDKPPRPAQKLKGATTLKNSDTRKLMALTSLYFSCKIAKELELYRNGLKNREFNKEALQNFDLERATIVRGQGASEDRNFEEQPTRSKTDSSVFFGINPQKKEKIFTNNLTELSEFMDHIVGVDLMAKSKKSDILCADFVFSSEPWFPEEAEKLSGPIEDILTFLQEKKYTLTPKPQEGAVVVYCSSETKTASHYGIVESVDENGDVKVLSKFGTHPVFLHLVEAVHYIHGNQIFYLVPPEPL